MFFFLFTENALYTAGSLKWQSKEITASEVALEMVCFVCHRWLLFSFL